MDEPTSPAPKPPQSAPDVAKLDSGWGSERDVGAHDEESGKGEAAPKADKGTNGVAHKKEGS